MGSLWPNANEAEVSGLCSRVNELSNEVAELADPNVAILKAEVRAIKSRLEFFKAPNSPLRDNRKLLYQEAGQWARHFSTVRMTVITFTITTCAAFIALQKDWPPNKSVVIPVGILWLLGILTFWIFTSYTYHKIRQQQKNHPLLASDFGDGLRPHRIPFDGASLIIPVLSGGYIWLLTLANPCGTAWWTWVFWCLIVAYGVYSRLI